MMKTTNLDKQRIVKLSSFCKAQKITFSDILLLDQAFHHRSLTNEIKGAKNNERLEFLYPRKT